MRLLLSLAQGLAGAGIVAGTIPFPEQGITLYVISPPDESAADDGEVDDTEAEDGAP